MSDPSLRIEQALRMVPDLEFLAPLRAVLISASQQDARDVWASSAPYLTVGKRHLRPGEARRRVPQALREIKEHLSALYDAVLDALEFQGSGEPAKAVTALLQAGEREERLGRLTQARVWYHLALDLSEGLRDRRPQVQALRHLGHVCGTLGEYAAGARCYQTSLALAEAELDTAGAVIACQGLGNIALAQGAWREAEYWYGRGLALGESIGDELRVAQLHHNLSIVARREGDLSAAGDHLRRAREVFKRLGEAEEMARALNSQGLLDAGLGRQAEALAAYREALAWVKRSGNSPWLEMSIRINLSELHLDVGIFLEAEEEIRQAEEIAIRNNLTRFLAQIYAVMGKLHGRQADENGFVFFEKAIELCRSQERSPLVEGQVYYEYGVFRAQLGEQEEARARLERAREIFESLGDVPELKLVRAQLERLARDGRAEGAEEPQPPEANPTA